MQKIYKTFSDLLDAPANVAGYLYNNGAGVLSYGNPSPDLSGYALLAGRAGGQTLIGSTLASENLTLQSTSHATKGKILFGTSAYDEVNNRLGIGTTSPYGKLDVIGIVTASANYGLLNIGPAATAFDGSTAGKFTGSASGTQLAVNAVSGFAGKLIDTQVNGVTKFQVTNAGNVGVKGAAGGESLTVNGNTYTTGAFYTGNGYVSPDGTAGTLTLNANSTNYSAFYAVKMATGTFSAAGGYQRPVSILPIYNQASGTAANTDLLINRTQTAVGSGAQLLIDAQVSTVSQFSVSNIGNVNLTGVISIDGIQVVSNRVIDARAADVANSGDATTDGLIDSLRDAMITHGLLAAA